MYYLDKDNNLYQEPTTEVIERFKLKKITKEEFDKILKEKNTPSEEQLALLHAEQELAEIREEAMQALLDDVINNKPELKARLEIAKKIIDKREKVKVGK